MSESGIIQIITLAVSTLSGGFMVWMRWKITQGMRDHNKIDREVNDKVDEVIGQNQDQIEKIEDMKSALNGRITQMVNTQVNALIHQAVTRAVSAERTRVAEEVERNVAEAIRKASGSKSK